MKKKNIKYSVAIILLMMMSMIIYWYFNPTIHNKDFHLQYEVANADKDFYSIRNKKIDPKKYTYNNEIYFSRVERYKLTLHSLDITNNGERIMIVTDYLEEKNNKRIVNITYKDKSGNFSPIIIKHKRDSVFIIQSLGSVSTDNIMFKGQK
ncbi:hypothetical protein [Pedobacter sp.]|uniref:hypothetical protein n=1 Tax=Pedobacter sp. TaxID=1411316 RepID=UPI0031D1A494